MTRSIRQCLELGRTLLAGTSSASIDAQLLLAHVLGTSRTALIAHSHESLSPEHYQRYRALLERRRNHEPTAYLIGRREFWSLDLSVTPAVLIPRPETELLVECCLNLLRPVHHPTILEIGVGSGAVSAALAFERPDATLTATEISADAIDVAQRNFHELGLDNRVTLIQGDLFAEISQPFDLICSNPPYVRSTDELMPDVQQYEPAAALFAGEDGLEVIGRVIRTAPVHLTASGYLVLEHGADQADNVRNLFQSASFAHPQTLDDLAGHPRVTYGRRSL